ncbi:MAG TPA: dienelactone hydrolase family protein [Longimicrobiales bacterium]|nr:dienelactone hydrolase family protein [Longimicrobiales bacterium]
MNLPRTSLRLEPSFPALALATTLSMLSLSSIDAAPAAAQEHPVLGELEMGPHPVGFTVEYTRDPSRVERPEVRPDGTPETRPIARLMQVALWYPASDAASGTAMTLGDYIDLQNSGLLADDRRDEGILTETQRAELVREWATWNIMTGVALEDWERLLPVRMRASRDAVPAGGAFPLILMIQGANGSVADMMGTAEYLASHGYVVVTAPSRGPDQAVTRVSADPRLTESIMQDAEYAIGRAATRDFVAVRQLGVLGWSRGGTAALLLGMRNPSIDAIVSFDSGLGRLAAVAPSFDPSRLTAPVLAFHTGWPGPTYPPLDSLRYADVHIVPVSGVHHVDFSAIGMIHTALHARNRHVTASDEHIRSAHEWINRYTLLFMDARVKQDERAVARFEKIAYGDAGEGAPSDILTVATRAGRPAPPAAGHLAELVWRRGGIGEAAGLIRAARDADPEWLPFPEQLLNAAGYRFMELGRHDEAIGVLRLNVELYPESANVYDSLGEILMLTGDREGAIENYSRSLALDPTNTNARRLLRTLTEESD